MSFVTDPQFFGIQDHSAPGSPPFGVRVYHPTNDDLLLGSPLPKGPFPLVIFAHGQRSGPTYCPPDASKDHRRWTRVLGAVARSGFVVAAPQMILGSDPSLDAQRIDATIRWMRSEWSGRASIHRPLELHPGVATAAAPAAHAPAAQTAALAARLLPGDFALPGQPTALALVGHSWGARACALVAAAGGVDAVATIAGTFDDNASLSAMTSLRIPTFMTCGTNDQQTFAYLTLWSSLHAPKYQAAFQGAEHWDWFGRQGAIRRCDGTPPAWPDTGHIAGELLVGFLTRHVARVQFNPQNGVYIPLLRPWLVPWYSNGAIQSRWDAPGEHFDPLPPAGTGILGLWTESPPW